MAVGDDAECPGHRSRGDSRSGRARQDGDYLMLLKHVRRAIMRALWWLQAGLGAQKQDSGFSLIARIGRGDCGAGRRRRGRRRTRIDK